MKLALFIFFRLFLRHILALKVMHLKLLIIYCTKNLSEQTAPISVKHDKKPKLGLFRSQGNYI